MLRKGIFVILVAIGTIVPGGLLVLNAHYQRMTQVVPMAISQPIIPNRTSSNDNIPQCINSKYSTSRNISGRLLTLFTTLRDVKVRERLHNQTLMNWASLKPSVLPVLFVMPNDSEYWTWRATELGWRVEKVPRTRENVPIVKAMFNVTSQKYPSPFIGFANADNLFGNSLTDTLTGLSKCCWNLLHGRMSLLVGRRRGVNVSEISEEPSGEYVDQIASRFKMHSTYAQDYFIFGGGGSFRWEDVPDFVVGRVGYDNWFVVMAQRWNVSLVDCSETISNLHQQGKDGHRAGWTLNKGRSKYINYRAAGKHFSYRGGITKCSFWSSTKTPPQNNSETLPSISLKRRKRGKGCRHPDIKNLTCPS